MDRLRWIKAMVKVWVSVTFDVNFRHVVLRRLWLGWVGFNRLSRLIQLWRCRCWRQSEKRTLPAGNGLGTSIEMAQSRSNSRVGLTKVRLHGSGLDKNSCYSLVSIAHSLNYMYLTLAYMPLAIPVCWLVAHCFCFVLNRIFSCAAVSFSMWPTVG